VIWTSSRLCWLGRFRGLRGFRQSAPTKSWSLVPAGAVLRPAGGRKAARRTDDGRWKTGVRAKSDKSESVYATEFPFSQIVLSE